MKTKQGFNLRNICGEYIIVAELIEEVLNNPENEQVIKRVREKVNATMKDYPLFAY